MTEKEAIQKMIEHFSAPDAVFGFDHSTGQCVYRGDGDPASSVRCSIGVLIEDSEYSPSMESLSVYALTRTTHDFPAPESLLAITDSVVGLDMIKSIQRKHDDLAQNGDTVPEFVNWLKQHV